MTASSITSEQENIFMYSRGEQSQGKHRTGQRVSQETGDHFPWKADCKHWLSWMFLSLPLNWTYFTLEFPRNQTKNSEPSMNCSWRSCDEDRLKVTVFYQCFRSPNQSKLVYCGARQLLVSLLLFQWVWKKKKKCSVHCTELQVCEENLTNPRYYVTHSASSTLSSSLLCNMCRCLM